MFPALILLTICSSPAPACDEPAARWLRSQGGVHPSAEEIVRELGEGGARGFLALERSLGARLGHPAWQRTFDELVRQAAILMESKPSPNLRAFGMLAAQRHGEKECLSPLIQLSRLPSDATGEAQGKTGAALADALVAILRRDEAALPKLRLSEVPRMHLPPLADRLGRLADPRALALLVELMDGDAGLEQAALSAIARLARTVTLIPKDRELRRVRYRIEHPNQDLRMLACQALGHLQDGQSARLLQGRLSDPSPSVRCAAHTALRRITGLRLHQGSRAWLSWIRIQEDWWNERSALVLAALPGALGSERASLLREIAAARLHRRALTMALLDQLERSEEEHIPLLLAAIVALDSPGALAEITLLLGHPSRGVREAATLAIDALRAPETADSAIRRTS